MALVTKTSLRNGWHRLREGATLVGRLRPRFDFLGAAKVARRGLADLLFPPSCLSCAAELDEGAWAGRDVHLCDGCLDEMEVFSGPLCARCGAPLPSVSLGENEVAIKPRQ